MNAELGISNFTATLLAKHGKVLVIVTEKQSMEQQTVSQYLKPFAWAKNERMATSQPFTCRFSFYYSLTSEITKIFSHGIIHANS